MYTVTTWNINGLRSAKDLKQMLDKLDSDIICFQETKITREMLSEPLAIVPGYTSYFDFSRRRSGYSGVATYCRQSATPSAAEAGVAGSGVDTDSVGCYGEIGAELEPAERKELDGEGRCVITLHRTACQCPSSSEDRPCHVAVLNVYCPRVDPDRPERLAYKLLFYRALRLRAAALRAAGHHVLLVGDLNCSHRPADSCDPGDLKEFAASPSRRFLDDWLCKPSAAEAAAPDQLVDSFRLLHPAATEVYTCWNTQRAARQLNFGTRIDYVLCDAPAAAAGLVYRCDVLADVQGSDHCPVRATIGARLEAAGRPPPACTRYYPEFAGRQLTIKQWCSGQAPGGKRPPQQPAQRQAGKRARGGQATLLGFVKRSKVPSSDSGGGGGKDQDTKAQSDELRDHRPQSSDRVCAGESDQTPEGGAATANGGAVESSDSSGGSSWQSTPTEPDGAERKVAAAAAAFWSETLRALRPPPCRGHREPCVQRVVKKAGPNLGKQFWCCARGVGKPGDPEAHCGHFEWLRRGGRGRSSDVTTAVAGSVAS
ncbi:DNA-(apurinic or apyrimidinic site) endonuclease 2-like [Amphibalanus amphitrite]|uniref:DNA-(apurinic or apyrimidinic site) endonuclease 2-like n=1 Tax=Amphibalanus amphitrite TaxID=1232801 RepID=UPI001C906383|nr:DNA-(apurinic or apyrimidinic site) endonuclease 2-like [Amphibalanus amphitrite]XP_043201353.1 DNA-(apurinic or apyrimidinic site) endonuclease 2-like [Amphibalanus amphitrite]XP_043201354.1 DNA-(apurinic or apyrimidinic site) endonuclease 2-like [Amphibalanus amphitrite]XP_043222534.1 DNA-(apurinic or apyrimidinic site) endonuclease 2-like [Amphibalanus amphitrite]XP_043222535.1 DNA-(apurinic or apyrimidinic site) endonuclease 2-like [Amphibalanus amphitrite]